MGNKNQFDEMNTICSAAHARGLRRPLRLLAAAVLTGAVVLGTAGCGGSSSSNGSGSSAEVSVSVDDLAAKLNSETVTEDTLSETAESMLSTIYFFSDGQIADGAAYMSSGATADEICVVECAEASSASDVEELFSTRVSNQSELYETYNADEVAKLKDAIIRSAGKYTVLVVCDDYSKAEEILKEAGF